jgi:hypothetical protein
MRPDVTRRQARKWNERLLVRSGWGAHQSRSSLIKTKTETTETQFVPEGTQAEADSIGGHPP